MINSIQFITIFPATFSKIQYCERSYIYTAAKDITVGSTDQLPVDLTGIEEVMGSTPVLGLYFFFHNCLSCVVINAMIIYVFQYSTVQFILLAEDSYEMCNY